jgi:hypothetical protein
MSKKSIGTGITRLLFGLKGKEMKVIPYNEMSPQQFEQLDRLLGKVGFLLASDTFTLTKKQSDYIFNQIKQLDLYREKRIKDKYTDFIDYIPRDKLGLPKKGAPDFKGFKPKIVQGGKDKTRPGNIDYDKMSEFLGVKLRGDETFEELLEIEKRMKGKDPEKFAGGGIPGLLAKMQAKFGKKAITTADKLARPESALNREMFGEFNERMNRRILDVEETPSGFKLSREKLLKNFPELDENMADEIMALDRDLQLRVITMLKDRRKNPEAYDKLLMEKGDTLDFQGEFDRSVQRSKNAGGGLATMFRPKREEFIFGGGVGFKNLLKSIAKKQGIKGSDVLKQGNPKSQVPKRAKPFVSSRDMENMKELRIQQLENQLELLKTSRNLLANRDNFPRQFREVGDDMIRMMMPPEMKQTLKGSTIESLDREILQLENVIKNLRVGKDKRKLNADGGLATMFRPRLKNGGPPNPGRRTFLKLMAGLASIPIVGKLFKPAATVSKVVPLKNTTTTMPTWFPDFVDKMVTKNVGNKIDADVMLYKDKDLPGVELYKYDDGRIEVQGKNAYDSEYDINYTPPGVEVLDYKTGKSVKTPGDFEASDTVYRRTGPEMDDYDVDGEIVDDVEDILGGNSTMLEGYAKGTGKSKYTKGQYQIDRAEAMNERADFPEFEVDPTDYIDEVEDIEPFRKGGLATMFKKK